MPAIKPGIGARNASIEAFLAVAVFHLVADDSRLPLGVKTAIHPSDILSLPPPPHEPPPAAGSPGKENSQPLRSSMTR
jgi:hypothetical protein